MSYPPQQPPAPVQPGQYGPPSHFAQAPPPAPKRKKWPFIVGGFALLMIAGCVGVFALLGAGAKSVADGIDQADKNQKGANAVAGKVGTPTVDGKFQFTVTGMKCGATRVGSANFGEKAQGQFCMINVSIKNVGRDAELFDDSSQKAYDAKGTEFSTDGGAATYVNDENQTFLENINPGNTVRGTLVFDVPRGTKLASVVLHESMFTAGVRVPLS